MVQTNATEQFNMIFMVIFERNVQFWVDFVEESLMKCCLCATRITLQSISLNDKRGGKEQLLYNDIIGGQQYRTTNNNTL